MSDEKIEKTDLRSMIADAADAVEPTEAPVREIRQAEIPARQTEAPPEQRAESNEGRARGPDGKFLPKDGAETPPSTEMPEQKAAPAAQAADPPPADTPAEARGTLEAPEHWSSADKKWFATLPARKQKSLADRYQEFGSPSEVPPSWSAADKEWVQALPEDHRAAVIDRFKQLESGFTPRLQKLAQVEKEYGPAIEMFAPHMDAIRARGQTPSDVIRIWGTMEETLLRSKASGGTDPSGAHIVANIIRNYGVDPGAVAHFLQHGAPPPNGNGAAAPAYAPVDPQIMQKMQQIENVLLQREQQEVQTRVGSAQNDIDRFRDERTESGSLKHPFFSDLESDITELARLERSQGRPVDLPTLYERAAWANVSTRDHLLSQRQAERQSAAAGETKAKAEAARKASSSISGAPTPGQMPQGQPTNRKLRDTIAAALEEASQ